MMMADACKIEGCVQRTDRLERSLCLQKEENEERLRLQKEEYEERLRGQKDAHDERLRGQKDEHDERLRVEKEEHESDVEEQTGKVTMRYEERLRLQKEEHEKALLAQRDAIIKYYFPGYYPLPLEDFPLEIIALIADFVHDFGDLARMSLASHRLRDGVLLSYRWMIVRELIEATEGDAGAKAARIWTLLYDRKACIRFACAAGHFRLQRALQPSRREIVNADSGYDIAMHGRVDSLRHLHTTYGVTAAEVMNYHADRRRHPSDHIYTAVQYGQTELLQYLHSECGMTIPPGCLYTACCHAQLKSLKWLHSEVGLTAADIMPRDCPRSLELIAECDKDDDVRHDCIKFLRTDYGLTQNDARQVIRYGCLSTAQRRVISDVFELYG